MGNVISQGHWKGTENSICMVVGNEQEIVPYPLQNRYRKYRNFLKKEISSSVPGKLIFLVHFLHKFHIWKCRFCCSASVSYSTAQDRYTVNFTRVASLLFFS